MRIFLLPVGHLRRVGVRCAREGDLLALVDGLMVGGDGDVGRVVHPQPDLGRLGRAVGRVLRLARDDGLVVGLLGGELELGDGGDALGVLDLLCALGDALGEDVALAVQPGDLEHGSRLSSSVCVWWQKGEGRFVLFISDSHYCSRSGPPGPGRDWFVFRFCSNNIWRGRGDSSGKKEELEDLID